MSVRLYMDAHVHASVTEGLRRRGVDVLTAQDDDCTELDDPELLDRSTSLGRIMFSNDRDLLREATLRNRSGSSFAGVIYAHQLDVSIGQCIADLEFLATAGMPDDFAERVIFLPLK